MKAELHGPLAIHESIPGSGVSVTHVATGTAAISNVTPEVALRFIEETKHIDWSDPKASKSLIEAAILKADPKAKL